MEMEAIIYGGMVSPQERNQLEQQQQVIKTNQYMKSI